jgi:putative oxidoreductase
MKTTTAISQKQIDLAMLVLRVVVGATFMAHGAQKVFVYGFAGVSGSFAQMGIPMPGLMGPFIALLELFGGAALILGILTRITALGLAANMLGAIAFVHLENGFFLPNGAEFALSLFAPSVALALTGAGRFSVDALVAKRASNVDATSKPGALKRAA